MTKYCPFLKVKSKKLYAATGVTTVRETFGECVEDGCPYYDYWATTVYCTRVKKEEEDDDENDDD